jgi:uncharacterized protein YraI
VVALLALTAGGLVLFDSVQGDTEGAGEPTVVVAPAGSVTAGPVQRTATASGVLGTTIRAASVRTAPGTRAPILGTVPSGSDVEIDAKTTDAGWYRVIFPPGSELHGWVDAEDLEITGDVTALIVATAEPAVIVALPTDPPEVLTAIAEEQTALASITETPVGTPTPEPGMGLPDLVVGSMPVINDGQLFVTVVNQGTGDATGDLVVAVFNPDGTALLAGATLPAFTLPAGRSIDIGTGYMVTQDQSLLLVVDPNGDIEESENLNNQITIAIALGAPPPENPFATPTEAAPVEEPVTP